MDSHLACPLPEFCAHKDLCGSGPGPALLQCEREGGGSWRDVPGTHSDGDGGAGLSPGEDLRLHRTGVQKGVLRAALRLHQVNGTCCF